MNTYNLFSSVSRVLDRHDDLKSVVEVIFNATSKGESFSLILEEEEEEEALFGEGFRVH